LGYQGLLELCYRYGKYKHITAEVVYEGDDFEYQYGIEQILSHIPKGLKGAKPTHVWALYELGNGGERFVVWTWDEAMAHGEEFSDSFNKDKPWASPWLSNETSQEEMAKKSVLKSLLKYAPKSVEIASAAVSDEHVVVADKFEDAEGSHLRFDLKPDIKQLEAPDHEAQDITNQLNSVHAETSEKETVPVENGKNTVASQEQRQATGNPPQGGNTGTPTGAGNGKSGLFIADEEAALEEQYEREKHGDDGPDFSR